MAAWEKIYESRIVTPEEAATKILSGQRIFLTGNYSVPQKVLAALVKHAPNLHDVEICQALTIGPADYVSPAMEGHLRVNTMFISANVRKAVQEGRADYTPVLLSEFPLLFKNHHLPIDVAMIHVSPPDEHGFCSLGVEVGLTLHGHIQYRGRRREIGVAHLQSDDTCDQPALSARIRSAMATVADCRIRSDWVFKTVMGAPPMKSAVYQHRSNIVNLCICCYNRAKDMINRIKEIFLDTFAGTPEYIVRAPGRVNLLGEHVDYNDGFVLPAAIDRATYIGFSPSGTPLSSVLAVDMNDQAFFTLQSARARTQENRVFLGKSGICRRNHGEIDFYYSHNSTVQWLIFLHLPLSKDRQYR